VIASPDLAHVHALRDTVRPLSEADRHDALMDAIGDARLVLLGEATHGTHEFYEERARLTRRLVVEKGFHAVAVEADWPDAVEPLERMALWEAGEPPETYPTGL
jgi:erythromycin esterase-like protein